MQRKLEARFSSRTAEQAYQEDCLEAAYREQPRHPLHPKMAEIMRRTFQTEAEQQLFAKDTEFNVERTVFEA